MAENGTVKLKRVIGLKRITIALMLVMLLGIAVASAEITRGVDSFSGSQLVNSRNDISGQIDSILLSKTINLDTPEYELSVNKRTMNEFALAKTTIEIKVDNNASRKFDVKTLQKIPTEKLYKFSYHIKCSIDQETINAIRNAERVAIRVELVNGWQPVIILEENILAEWKEVIATEK